LASGLTAFAPGHNHKAAHSRYMAFIRFFCLESRRLHE